MDEQVAPIMQKHISGNNDSDYAMCLCVCVCLSTCGIRGVPLEQIHLVDQ